MRDGHILTLERPRVSGHSKQQPYNRGAVLFVDAGRDADDFHEVIRIFFRELPVVMEPFVQTIAVRLARMWQVLDIELAKAQQ